METPKDTPQDDRNNTDKINHFYSILESFSQKTSKPTTTQQDLLLKFMEKTIAKINYCMASLYATQQLLIQKGVVTRSELLNSLREAKGLPVRTVGRETLTSILENNDIDSILTMIDLPESGDSDKTN